MPRPRAEAVRDVEARVINWARAMRGGLPTLTRGDGTGLTPDELDAAKVEAVMVALKRHPNHGRRRYWAVIRAKWLQRKLDEQASRELRMSYDLYRRTASDALVYLAGRLEE